MVASEHYNRIARLLDGKVPVQLELNVQNRFFDEPLDASTWSARSPGPTAPTRW